jgi:HAD superfamily hydrolase (TIGR01509 family)
MIDWDRYRLVTVDGDGTLWNFELTLRRALQRTADQFAARLGGVGPAVEHVTPTELRRLRDEVSARPDYAHASMDQIRRASFAEAAARVSIDDEEFVEGVFLDYMDYRFRHLVHYSDARPFLTAVRRLGLLVALVTNGNTTAKKAALCDVIDASFVAYDVGLKKPDPQIYRHVVERMGVDAHATLHIGDDPIEDVDAARAAGLSTAWLDREGAQWPSTLDPPARRLRSLADCMP